MDAFGDLRRDVVHVGRDDPVQQRDAVEDFDVQPVVTEDAYEYAVREVKVG